MPETQNNDRAGSRVTPGSGEGLRILIHGWGSRGDVEPAINLARALASRGHEADVAAATDFEQAVVSQGLGYVPIDVDMRSLTRSPAGVAWLGGGARNLVHEMRLMGLALRPAAEPIGRMLAQTSTKYDYVVTVPALLEATLTLHEPDRLTCLMLQPGLPTRRAAPNAVAPGGHDGLGNLIASARVALDFRRALRPFAACTAQEAHVHRRSSVGLVTRARLLHYLIGASPRLVPPAKDWPVSATVTGFLRPPRPAGALLAPELERFLRSGSAPVFVGFGSMPASDANATEKIVGEAIRRAGVRAIVGRGNAGIEIRHEDVLSVDDVPYEHLFPRLSGVVHHGGAGTTAAALQAGVAQVAVPHMGDQFYWGRRVHELGLGPRSIRRHELTAARLAAAITALAARRFQSRAKVMQRLIVAEDGLSQACDLIEQRAWRARREARE